MWRHDTMLNNIQHDGIINFAIIQSVIMLSVAFYLLSS
jgi:hypothetical protein